MAKPQKAETPAEVVDNATLAAEAAPATAEGTTAPAAAKKAGGAAIVLENGMRRIDYIRQEFAKGRKRGEIAKELGVAYQIVFAATKADKAAETPAADASAPVTEAAPAEGTATDAPAEAAAA